MSSSISPDLARARSRLGVASKHGDPLQVEQARREFAEARLVDYVKRTLTDLPAPGPETVRTLIALLQPESKGHAA